MGTTGAPYNLRYPELNDAANVPTDMSELAADVARVVGNVVQSGVVNITLSAELNKSVTVTFPHAFPTAPRVVAMAATTSVFFCYAASTPTATAAVIGIRAYEPSPQTATVPVHWIAVAGQ
jgi:hypothetical protein